MGCNTSKAKYRKNGSSREDRGTRGQQDDARSYRSKVGAIKMLTKNPQSYSAFSGYLETLNKAQLLTCYQDLEEIKTLTDEQSITRTTALVWRYKTIYESIKIHEAKPRNVEVLLWEALGKLRQIDNLELDRQQLTRLIVITQNDLLSRLIIPFEEFLNSHFYRDWQDRQLNEERARNSNRARSPKIALSGQQQPVVGCMDSNGISSTGSMKSLTYSDTCPDVLVVDDSTVTLKLTGLTLEKDGHTVDKATNGQIALDLLRSRMYDIVLIDLNMPVMDGFETVRLFREYEGQHVRSIPELSRSDVSSMSDDSGAAADQEAQPNCTTVDVLSPRQRPRSSHKNKPFDDLNNRQTSRNVLGTNGAPQDEITAAHYHQLIIGMSTNVDEVTRKKAKEAGMDYFLPKPFTLQKFIETIRLSRADVSIRQTSSVGVNNRAKSQVNG